MNKITLYFTTFIISSQVLGWGANGHRIVGEIAERHLSKRGRTFIKKYLGTEKLAHASVWADEIRSDKNKSSEIALRWGQDLLRTSQDPSLTEIDIANWHYVSIPNGLDYSSSPKNPKGDILWAMKKMDKVLRSKTTTPFHKKEAIRLMSHFIGDIHQPFHAGIKEDRGANYCWVNFFPRRKKNIIYGNSTDHHHGASAHPKYVNLHSLWDTELIDSLNLSFSEYATKINRPDAIVLSKANKKEELKLEKLSSVALSSIFHKSLSEWRNLNYNLWVKESVLLREKAYPKINVKNANPENLRPYCFASRDALINDKDIPIISYKERAEFLKVIDYRLLQAGVRLAHFFNTVAQ